MSKTKHIKIPLPKWKWWQTALILGFIIAVIKLDPNTTLRMLKDILLKWLS